MPKVKIQIFDKEFEVTTFDNKKPPLLILGPAFVQAASLQKVGLSDHFDFIIPNAPFQQEPTFTTENFKTFIDYINFYIELMEKLGQQSSQYQKATIYGHSALGIIALMFGIMRPDLTQAVIINGTPIFLSQIPEKAFKNWRRNIYPGFYYTGNTDTPNDPSDPKFSGEYYKESYQAGPPLRYQIYQQFQADLHAKQQKQVISYEEEYTTDSPLIWYTDDWAQNKDNIALKFWTEHGKTNTSLIKENFFPLLIRDAPSILPQIYSIQCPVFYSTGIYDGKVAPLLTIEEEQKLKSLPNWTRCTFEYAAHWPTEDPDFTKELLKWYDAVSCTQPEENCSHGT